MLRFLLLLAKRSALQKKFFLDFDRRKVRELTGAGAWCADARGRNCSNERAARVRPQAARLAGPKARLFTRYQ